MTLAAARRGFLKWQLGVVVVLGSVSITEFSVAQDAVSPPVRLVQKQNDDPTLCAKCRSNCPDWCTPGPHVGERSREGPGVRGPSRDATEPRERKSPKEPQIKRDGDGPTKGR